MNRHLSVFLPYDRPPEHEDQLTRAAMIVMRAVPLARDALLSRLKAPTSARLPEPELDMQTSFVMAPSLVAEPEELMLYELISVFLSPDEGLNLSGADIAERARRQRLDGVLRFGDQLVVVIECKTVPRYFSAASAAATPICALASSLSAPGLGHRPWISMNAAHSQAKYAPQSLTC